jgi:hypothetical protein
MGFNFGLSNKGAEEGQEVVIMEREYSPRGEDMHGMKPLGSIDSREQIAHDGYKTSTHDARASQAKTEYSKEDSDIIEASPRHALGHAR